jgi:alkanesulfonate monooxygenase SsuD/methylene tetrahydromethanopterin reductase-like flavin-dependent oxidoreductase (luciferase family)
MMSPRADVHGEDTMKFGLLYEIEKSGLMDPATGRVDLDLQQQVFDETIEQIKLADEVGFDHVWEVEHHFLGDFSFSSAPEIVLSAIARETKRIRIGHGVVLLPFKYNHPVRVAERIATLDILSGGRLEFGTGRSASLMEMDGFGVDPANNRAEWDESLHMIAKIWKDDLFSWESPNFSIPPRPVVPRPKQQPHPPVWMAATQPESIEVAASRGLGILHFTYSQPEALERKIELYRETMDRSEPVFAFKNPNFGAFTMLHCGRDDAESLAVGGAGMEWYVRATNGLYGAWAQTNREHSYGWYAEAIKSGAFLGARQARGEEDVDIARMSDEAILCIGGPDRCEQICREFERRGVDQMLFLVQSGPSKHDAILDSLRRFGEQVIPRFRQ